MEETINKQDNSVEKEKTEGIKDESQGWSSNNIRLLISTYAELKQKFDSPAHNKATVWKLISDNLKQHGVNKDYKKCDEKFRNLKKRYEKVKAQNNKTGVSPTTWEFYKPMHELFFNDPKYTPVLTASSTGLIKKRALENQSSNTEEPSSSTKSKTQKLTLEIVEERKQKRHDEKIAMKKEMFSWFKEHYKKE